MALSFAEPDFEPATVGPVIASETVLLDPNEIEVADRLREIDMAWAEAIGRSIERDGQINAIHVCAKPEGGWRLAGPGGHRTLGCRMAGVPIEAKIVSANVAGQRRREAAENVFRRPNNPVERAAAVAELVRLHKERAGIVEAGRREASVPKSRGAAIRDEAGATLDTMSNVYGWTAEIGAELGFSDRTIRRDLEIYRGIAPSLLALLTKSRRDIIANATQLRALAKLDPDQQRHAVQLIVQDEFRAKSVGEAISRIAGKNSVAMDPEAKRLSTFIGTFNRMGVAEKKGALAQLAGMLPAGFRLIEGEEA